MPKQLAEPKKSVLERPDRSVRQARKEAAQRVEELKIKIILLTDKYFEQSLRIIKSWLQENEKNNGRTKR